MDYFSMVFLPNLKCVNSYLEDLQVLDILVFLEDLENQLSPVVPKFKVNNKKENFYFYIIHYYNIICIHDVKIIRLLNNYFNLLGFLFPRNILVYNLSSCLSGLKWHIYCHQYIVLLLDRQNMDHLNLFDLNPSMLDSIAEKY